MPGKRKHRQRRRDWDSPWKETLQHFLEDVLAFFFPSLHDAVDWSKGYESLDKEFQQIVADARAGRGLADKLFKVWRTDGREQWLLVHIEVQGHVERRFGRRMFRYNIRCFELYDRRVVSLAILCDDNPEWRPHGFSYGGWGSRTGIRFPTVKLLDYAGREAELAASTNPVGQVVLAHLGSRATQGEPESRRARKLLLVKGLYDRNWVHQFEEERHMPYVTSIERLAKKEGRQEGARSELLETIQVVLKKKFGKTGSRLMSKVRLIKELPRLRTLRLALIETESLQVFRELLD